MLSLNQSMSSPAFTLQALTSINKQNGVATNIPVHNNPYVISRTSKY